MFALPVAVVLFISVPILAYQSLAGQTSDAMQFLRQLAMSTETRFAEFSRLAATVRRSPELQSHRLRKADALTLYLARRSLSQLAHGTVADASRVYYFVQGLPYVLSPVGVYGLYDTAIPHYESFGGLQDLLLRTAVSRQKAGLVELGAEGAFYVEPVAGSVYPRSALVIALAPQWAADAADPALCRDCVSVVRDEAHQTVKTVGATSDAVPSVGVPELPRRIVPVDFLRSPVVGMSSGITSGGREYIVWLPRSAAFRRTLRDVAPAVIGIGVGGLIASLLLALLADGFVARAEQACEQSISGSLAATGIRGVDRFLRRVARLARDCFTVKEELASLEAVRNADEILESALSGAALGPGEERVSVLGASAADEVLRAAVFRGSSTPKTVATDLHEILADLRADYHLVLSKLHFPSRQVGILGSRPDHAAAALHAIDARLLGYETHTGQRIVAFIGPVATRGLSLARSYHIADAASSLCLVRSDSRVVSLDDRADPVSDARSIPRVALNELRRAVLYDPAHTRHCLEELASAYLHTDTSYYARIRAVRETAGLLAEGLHAHRIADTDSREFLRRVEAGEQLLTYDELLSGFGRVAEALDQAWSERHREDETARRIVALADEAVQRNLSDPQLSVCRLAELVAVSESHLRRTYREYRGVSLGEHLTLERIRAAQDLLKRGDSVKSVVRSVGYTNDSSFIRKFKSVVGVTPGEFRRTERFKEEQPLGRPNRLG